MSAPRSLAKVIGAEFRRNRIAAGLTLEQVADDMRTLGFGWSAPRVAALEAGRVSPTLGMLLALVKVLDDEMAGAMTLQDLIPNSKEDVIVAPGVLWTANSIRAALDPKGGHLVTTGELERTTDVLQEVFAGAGASYRGGRWTKDRMTGATIDFTLADERAAKALGVSMPDFLTASVSIWGWALSREREERAVEGASAQGLGRVTRVLMDELREYLASVDDAGVLLPLPRRPAEEIAESVIGLDETGKKNA